LGERVCPRALGCLELLRVTDPRSGGDVGRVCHAQSRLIQANDGSLRGCGGEARDAGGPRGWGLPKEAGWVGVEAA
jgi:hypothetical protein